MIVILKLLRSELKTTATNSHICSIITLLASNDQSQIEYIGVN